MPAIIQAVVTSHYNPLVILMLDLYAGLVICRALLSYIVRSRSGLAVCWALIACSKLCAPLDYRWWCILSVCRMFCRTLMRYSAVTNDEQCSNTFVPVLAAIITVFITYPWGVVAWNFDSLVEGDFL